MGPESRCACAELQRRIDTVTTAMLGLLGKIKYKQSGTYSRSVGNQQVHSAVLLSCTSLVSYAEQTQKKHQCQGGKQIGLNADPPQTSHGH